MKNNVCNTNQIKKLCKKAHVNANPNSVNLQIYRRIDGNSKKGEEAESLVGIGTKTKL